MTTTWVVLWLYMATPWTLGPLPMTPGWYAMGPYYEAESCQQAAARLAELRGSDEGILCLEPNRRPRPLAKPLYRNG